MTVVNDWKTCQGIPLAEPKAGWADIMIAVAIAFIGIIAVVIATLLATAIPGQYVIVAPLGHGRGDLLDIVYRADGGVTGFGGFQNIAIAASDNPDFSSAAVDGGAWFVLPAPRLLGCFTPVAEVRE